jgi:hypothetical protein
MLPVFKIPPLKKNEGHRAQEWGDLGNPLWKGRLRIIEKGAGVTILFEDPNTGTMLCRLSAYVVTDRTLKVNVCRLPASH